MPLPPQKTDRSSRTAIFSMLVRDFARSASDVLEIRPGTSCGQVIEALATRKLSCAVVVDAAGRPVGIVTERDVVRRIAFRVPAETPIESVMTAPVLSIRRREHLYCAIAWMRRHDLRHMPVVDRAGRLAGIIYLHDALAAASDGLMRQIDVLSREDTLEGMKQVKAAQVELARGTVRRPSAGAGYPTAAERASTTTCTGASARRR